MNEEMIRAQIPHVLQETDFPLGKKYKGKVRDNYTVDEKRIIIVSDRVSAFDRVLGYIPFKGQVLCQMAKYWFDRTEDIVKNHLIEMPDPNVMVCHECEALPVEAVVRAYNTGSTTTSVWHAYKQGKREFCGNRLPDGMNKNEPFPKPIFTPSTKALQGEHDESVSADEIVERGLVSRELMDQIETVSMRLFELGQNIVREQGIILVDTKYEFGLLDGELVLIDEIHTPDSSRFWHADTYDERVSQGKEPQKLDKEYLRIWLSEQGFTGEGAVPEIPEDVLVESAKRYIRAYELITGETFKAQTGNPMERIRKNLQEREYDI